jgi:hypothetical protein
MFTKIKEFFLGKPAPEAQAPYKIEIAPATAPIVAEPVTAKPAAKKAASAPKKQQFDKKPAAKKAAPKKQQFDKKPAAKKPA